MVSWRNCGYSGADGEIGCIAIFNAELSRPSGKAAAVACWGSYSTKGSATHPRLGSGSRDALRARKRRHK